MRTVVQRVKSARVIVEGVVRGQIAKGYLLFVGFQSGDTEETVARMADKILKLRIFSDDNAKMNLALTEVQGAILSVSQFTLYGNVKGGRRPSFSRSASAEDANKLYEYFNTCLKSNGTIVETGVFQAEMEVELCNDGPVTILLDSEDC